MVRRFTRFVFNVIRYATWPWLFLSLLLLLNGCALFPRAPLVYQAGAVVETLSAAASLSIS